MVRELGFIGTIITSGLAGAFGASLLFIIWTWLFQPKLFEDGQYGMVFLFTSPIGWLLGSVLGAAIVLTSNDVAKPQHPFLISVSMVVGGLILIPIPGMLFMMLFLGFIGMIIERFKR